MIFFGWFDRRDFNMDITDPIESLLELLKLKFEFAFIKYSKYDINIQIFCSPKPSSIYGKLTLYILLWEISWHNIHLCSLLNNTF